MGALSEIVGFALTTKWITKNLRLEVGALAVGMIQLR